MSHAPTMNPAPTTAVPTVPADVLAYASPGTTGPRITYRGAVTTLAVGGGLLALAIALLTIAWSIFRDYAERGATSSSSPLEILGIFVCLLAGLTFIIGLITVFVGLRNVRQRELA